MGCGSSTSSCTSRSPEPWRRGGGHSRGVPIRYYEDLGPPGGELVVSYVGKRGAGAFIRAFLVARGWVEGEHFLLAA